MAKQGTRGALLWVFMALLLALTLLNHLAYGSASAEDLSSIKDTNVSEVVNGTVDDPSQAEDKQEISSDPSEGQDETQQDAQGSDTDPEIVEKNESAAIVLPLADEPFISPLAIVTVRIGGVEYSVDTNTYLARVNGPTTGIPPDLVIPATITYNSETYSVNEMAYAAFRDNTTITSLTILAPITDIPAFAFQSCSRLTTVTINEGATSLGINCFAYCNALTTVNLPNSMTTISGDAFDRSTSLRNVTHPKVAEVTGELPVLNDLIRPDLEAEGYTSIVDESTEETALYKSAKWTDENLTEASVRVDYGKEVEAAVDFVFVLDYSESMFFTAETTSQGVTYTYPRNMVLDDVVSGAIDLVLSKNGSGPDQGYDNRVALTAFGTNTLWSTGFYTDPSTAKDAVGFNHYVSQRTNYGDGLNSALNIINDRGTESDRKPIVIFFSDGQPTQSGTSQAASLRDAGYAVYPIAMFMGDQDQSALKAISYDFQTCYDAQDSAALAAAISQVVDESITTMDGPVIVDTLSSYFGAETQVSTSENGGSASLSGNQITWDLTGSQLGVVHTLYINTKLNTDDNGEYSASGWLPTNSSLSVPDMPGPIPSPELERYISEYSFISDTGESLPQGVLDQQPALDGGYANGATVSPSTLPEEFVDIPIYDMNNQLLYTWSFRSWDKPSEIVNNSNILFTGTWAKNEPTLLLEKSIVGVADGQYVTRGQVLTFELQLTNNTGATVTDVVVTDAVPSGTTFISAESGGYETNGIVTWDVGTLDNRAETTLRFSVSVNEDAPRGAIIQNKAQGSYTDSLGENKDIESNETSNPVDEITAIKSVNVGDGAIVEPNTTMNYTLGFTNNSSEIIQNFRVTDEIPAYTTFVSADNGGIETSGTVIWPARDLNPGESMSVSFVVTIENSPPLGSIIENEGLYSRDNGIDGSTNRVSNLVKPDEGKTVDVGDGTEVSTGDVLSYTISYVNETTETQSVTITDTVPEGTTYNDGSATSGGIYTDVSHTITWGPIQVEPNNILVVEFKTSIDESSQGATIENTARIDPGNSPSFNTNTVTNTVTPESAKSASVDGTDVSNGEVVYVGQEIEYTIIYENGSNADQNVTITDEIPQGTVFVEASSNGREENGVITWGPSILNSSRTLIVSFKVRVTEDALTNDNETVNNAADITLGNDVSFKTNEIINPVNPGGTKAAEVEGIDISDGEIVYIGQQIDYTISYTNLTGAPQALTITDAVPQGTVFQAVSTGGVYDPSTGIITWGPSTINDMVTVEVGFSVIVGEDAYYPVINAALINADGATFSTNTTENPKDMSGRKTAEVGGVDVTGGNTVYVGQQIDYTVSYTNVSQSSQGLTITDEVPEGTELIENTISSPGVYNSLTNTISWDLGQIGTNDFREVTFSATVIEPNNGTVENMATININNLGFNTNRVINPVNPGAVKTAEVEGEDITDGKTVAVGDTIDYSVSYTNNSETSKMVKISDTIPSGTEVIPSSIVNGIYNATTRTIVWNPILTAPGGAATVSYSVTVSQDTYDDIVNFALVDVEGTLIETNTIINPVNPGGHKSASVDGNDVSNGEIVYIGQEIIYVIDYSNDSSVTQTVTISDQVPSGTELIELSPGGREAGGAITWEPSIVGSGQDLSVFFRVKVTKDALDSISNRGSIGLNDVWVDTNEVTNPVNPGGTKTAEIGGGGNEVYVGQEMSYTISYTNNTASDQTVSISDAIPRGTKFISATQGGNYDEDTNTVYWPSTTLLPNRSIEVRLIVIVTEDAVDSITNKAIIDGDGVRIETNEVETPVNPGASKGASVDSKDVSNGEIIYVGQEIEYTINYRNESGAVQNVVVSDTIPQGTSLVENSINNGGTESGGVITWPSVTLGNNESLAHSFKVGVAEDALNNDDTTVKNLANLDLGNDVTILTNEIINPVNPGAEKTAEVEGAEVTDGKIVFVGQRIDYKIQYTNNTNAIQSIAIYDTLPLGIEIIESSIEPSGDYEESNRTITWSGIMLAPNVEVSAIFSAIVTDPSIDQITNTATIEADESRIVTNPVENPVNPPGEKTAAVEGTDVTDGQLVFVGQQVDYEITYENTLSEDQRVVVSDTIPAGSDIDLASIDPSGHYDTSTRTITWPEIILAPGVKCTMRFSVTVTEDALDSIRNSARISANESVVHTNVVENPVNPVGEKNAVIAGAGGSVYVGQEIRYSITHENATDTPQEVTITDTIPQGTRLLSDSITEGGNYNEETNTITWGPSQLASRTPLTVFFTVVVTEDATDIVTNMASIVVGEALIETNTVKTPVKPGVVKSAESNGLDISSGQNVHVEQEVKYAITYTNDSTSAQNVTISDTIPEGVALLTVEDGGSYNRNTNAITWNESNLAANTEMIVHFTVKIMDTALDLSDQKVRNIGRATIDSVSVATNEIVNPVFPGGEKAAEVEGSDIGDGSIVYVGQQVDYSISYINQTDATQKVIIYDEIPLGTELVNGSIEPDGNYNTSTRTITWNEIDLPSGEEITALFSVTVTDPSIDSISNVAFIEADEARFETNSVDNPVNPGAQKEVIAQSGSKTVYVGQKLDYFIRYTNNSGTSQLVGVSDEVPIGTQLVQSSIEPSGTYNEGNRTIIWNPISLNPGEDIEVRFSVIVTPDALVLPDRIIPNVASVTPDPNKPGVYTNRVENIVNPTGEKTAEVEGSDVSDGKVVFVGQQIDYQVSYANRSEEIQTVEIRDTLPSGTDFVSGTIYPSGTYHEDTRTIIWDAVQLAPGEDIDAGFSVTVVDPSIDEVTNAATIEPDNSHIETNTVRNPIEPAGKKTAQVGDTDITGGSKVYPSQRIDYTVEYTNWTKNTQQVLISDSIPEYTSYVETSATDTALNVTRDASGRATALTWGPLQVNPGTKVTVSFGVTVDEGAEGENAENRAWIDPGSFANFSTNEIINPIEEAGTAPRIEVEKTADKDRVSVGEDITYMVQVRNTGNADAQDVMIRDYIPEHTSFVSANDNAYHAIINGKDQVTWIIDTLAVGAEKSLTLVVKVNNSAEVAEYIENTVLSEIDKNDPTDPMDPRDRSNTSKTLLIKSAAGTETGTIAKTGELVILSFLLVIAFSAVCFIRIARNRLSKKRGS